MISILIAGDEQVIWMHEIYLEYMSMGYEASGLEANSVDATVIHFGGLFGDFQEVDGLAIL
jgi:hypothetical protein